MLRKRQVTRDASPWGFAVTVTPSSESSRFAHNARHRGILGERAANYWFSTYEVGRRSPPAASSQLPRPHQQAAALLVRRWGSLAVSHPPGIPEGRDCGESRQRETLRRGALP